MKVINLLILVVLISVNQSSGAGLERKFIRKAGRYSLDDQGSTLTITKQQVDSWSVKVTWHSGDATSSVAPDKCLVAGRWFIFVERPNRIWIFDGVDEGLFLSNSEKETGTKWFPGAAMRACPGEFWKALPQEIRAKYGKDKPAGAASRNQPAGAETKQGAAAARSDR